MQSHFLWAMGYGAFAIFFASMDALNPLTDGSAILTILKYIFFPITMPIALLYDIFANGSWKICIMGWTYFSVFLSHCFLLMGDTWTPLMKKGAEKKRYFKLTRVYSYPFCNCCACRDILLQ